MTTGSEGVEASSGQDLTTCVVCRGRIDDPAHIRLGELIAHEHCREYVAAQSKASFEAGQMHERHDVATWLRDVQGRWPLTGTTAIKYAGGIEEGVHVR